MIVAESVSLFDWLWCEEWFKPFCSNHLGMLNVSVCENECTCDIVVHSFFTLNIYGNEYLTLFSSSSSLVKHHSCVALVSLK